MEFNDYQNETHYTVAYPEDSKLAYLSLGLSGEAGELANKLKKVIRGDYEIEDVIVDLAGELGDCLWYIARLADELGLSLDDIAEANLEKLFDRKERNVIRGSGDNR